MGKTNAAIKKAVVGGSLSTSTKRYLAGYFMHKSAEILPHFFCRIYVFILVCCRKGTEGVGLVLLSQGEKRFLVISPFTDLHGAIFVVD